MRGRGIKLKLASIIGALISALVLAQIAGAKSTEALEVKETKITKQKATPEGGVGGTTDAGSQIREARSKLEVAESRTRELDRKTQDLQQDLEIQKEAASTSRARLEERVRGAYKGRDLADLTFVLNSVLGDDAKPGAVLSGPAVRMLTRGRQSIQFYRDSERTSKDALRRLERKKKKYEESRGKQQERMEELQQHETRLVVSFGGSDPKKEQLDVRISQLEAADQAGEITLPPASGSGGAGPVSSEREFEIAEEDIVASEVEPIPYERYLELYKAAAKRYGFEKDWYVLAAVGKIESDHGRNMGPSSAGAMGPMQFLPSTWREYGVDGNKDGDANIMDPEDAIPAAAAYLKEGGAPEDWEAALYVYNHAGWYVREVLSIAEGYRRLEKDDEVKPYI